MIEYLHCSSRGSYHIPCTVLARSTVPDYSKKRQDLVPQSFIGSIIPSMSEHHDLSTGEIYFIISYVDPFTDEVDFKEVHRDYLSFPVYHTYAFI